MQHLIELTEADVRQAIVEHINHSDLGVRIKPDQVSFNIVYYNYGERAEFEGATVNIDG